MFENKTYENIMKEMMEQMPSGVSTEEGSLIWNACSKQAMQLEEAYLAMQQVEDNMYADTQDEEHLILNGNDKGIKITRATCAVVCAEFSQEIEPGTRFTTNDLNYCVEERIEGNGFLYRMKCEEAGTSGNIGQGELTPIDFVDDYQGGNITGILEPGLAQEDIEEYRQRVKEFNNSRYFGGNRTDYIRFIENLDGVGAVKVKRRKEGDEYICPYILDTSYGVPAASLVAYVQGEIDPEQSHGDGDGIAPIGHKVIIRAAVGVTVNIETDITYDDGYSQAALQSQINGQMDMYLGELARTWRDREEIMVRIAQIETRILAVEGILDIANTKINGVGGNLTLAYEEIPVRGTINGI